MQPPTTNNVQGVVLTDLQRLHAFTRPWATASVESLSVLFEYDHTSAASLPIRVTYCILPDSEPVPADIYQMRNYPCGGSFYVTSMFMQPHKVDIMEFCAGLNPTIKPALFYTRPPVLYVHVGSAGSDTRVPIGVTFNYGLHCEGINVTSSAVFASFLPTDLEQWTHAPTVSANTDTQVFEDFWAGRRAAAESEWRSHLRSSRAGSLPPQPRLTGVTSPEQRRTSHVRSSDGWRDSRLPKGKGRGKPPSPQPVAGPSSGQQQHSPSNESVQSAELFEQPDNE